MEAAAAADVENSQAEIVGGDDRQVVKKQIDVTRTQDRERLRVLVRTFVTNAEQGITCGVMDLQTGAIEAAEYTVDKALRVFAVRLCEPPMQWSRQWHCGAGANQEQGHAFEIERITDVLLEDDLPLQLREPLREVTDETTRERLVLIRYAPAGGRPTGLACLVEQDLKACANFLTCMNILRLYADRDGCQKQVGQERC